MIFQQLQVQQDAVALHLEQYLHRRHFNSAINIFKLCIRCNFTVQVLMQLQRDVRIFSRILRGAFDIDLIKIYPAGTLACDLIIIDCLDAEMPQCKVIHIVQTVRFEHIGLEQRVMNDTVQAIP